MDLNSKLARLELRSSSNCAIILGSLLRLSTDLTVSYVDSTRWRFPALLTGVAVSICPCHVLVAASQTDPWQPRCPICSLQLKFFNGPRPLDSFSITRYAKFDIEYEVLPAARDFRADRGLRGERGELLYHHVFNLTGI
ncbi:hypothetical protein BDW69DRAFT_109777 [Aspergillus filifer]